MIEVGAIVGGGVGGRVTLRFGGRCRERLVVYRRGFAAIVAVRTPHRLEQAAGKEQIGRALNCW